MTAHSLRSSLSKVVIPDIVNDTDIDDANTDAYFVWS